MDHSGGREGQSDFSLKSAGLSNPWDEKDHNIIILFVFNPLPLMINVLSYFAGRTNNTCHRYKDNLVPFPVLCNG